MRVLVIDDEEVDRLKIQRALEPLGNHVETAVDGATGVAIANRFMPDVVLIDINMSQLDGYELCRQLRLDEQTLARLLG